MSRPSWRMTRNKYGGVTFCEGSTNSAKADMQFAVGLHVMGKAVFALYGVVKSLRHIVTVYGCFSRSRNVCIIMCASAMRTAKKGLSPKREMPMHASRRGSDCGKAP